MANASFLCLSLCALVLFNVCFADQIEQQTLRQLVGQSRQQQQQRRLRARTDCQFERITAREPSRRQEWEAGMTEFWDSNNDEFVCAGVDVVRNTIHRNGLLLPYYTNAPQLIYILQGRGIQGTVLPGCAETYQSSSSSGRSEEERGERGQRFDRHQKVYRFKQGDILALPAGVAHWAYNDGDSPIISIALQDTSNYANQLDQNFRKFFLAGNPQGRDQQQGRREGQEGRKRGEEQESGNIFNGFDDEILSEIFNVERETIRKMKGQDDQRGRIVRAERFEVVGPFSQEREEGGGRGRSYNGLEETVCSMNFRQNIGNPVHADYYNPRGGRITILDSGNLPALKWLQLSAESGVLYRNAVLAPHWNLNAHSIVYITRGGSRMQIVGNNGRTVFDDEVREGQVIVVPQNFAVATRAGDQGFEWVAFNTNDVIMTSTLAGRMSVIQSLPEDVLVNSFRISREQARNLKNNRQEAVVFGPGGSRSTRTSSPRKFVGPIEKVLESLF